MRKLFVLQYLLFYASLCVAFFFFACLLHMQQLPKPILPKESSAENTEASFPLATTINNKNRTENFTQQQSRRSLLIFGQDRTGTTFISTMFAKDPQIFTVYEPLWITRKWRSPKARFNCSHCELDVVSSIVGCNFSRSRASKKFLTFVHKRWAGALPINVFTKKTFCNVEEDSKRKTKCSQLRRNATFVDNVCKEKFKHSVVKVSPVRLPPEELANLVPQVLLENPDIDVRILHLVRDPRGIVNSRIKLKWIRDYPRLSLAVAARRLCNSTKINLEHAEKTLKQLNLTHRYKLVLYKQIAEDSLGTAKDIYRFAGFEMPPEIEKWIIETTNPSKVQLERALKNPYSPVRKASGNADKWKNDYFFERNRVIENECKIVMDLLGLKEVPEPERVTARESNK